jgi:hypothetical protein
MRNSAKKTFIGLIFLTASLCLFAATAADLNPDVTVKRINEICSRLLARPGDYDLTLAYELSELRNQNQMHKQAALASLADGLNAYLKGRFDVAAKLLTQASKVDQVAQMSQTILAVPLKNVIKNCNANTASEICENCGGTSTKNCGSCSASGWKICRKCKGQGKSLRSAQICEFCKGIGVIICQTCKGKGTVDCDCGKGKWQVDRATAKKIAKIIDAARYLRQGGLDLQNKEALKKSPQLKN